MKKIVIAIVGFAFALSMLCGCTGGNKQHKDATWQEMVNTLYG